MTTLRWKPTSDSAALVGSQIVSAAGSLLLLIVTSRALGASGRGVLSFLLLWPTLGAYFLALGIPAANLRSAAKNPGLTPRLVHQTVLVTSATGGLLALWAIVGLPSWMAGPLTPELVWIAIACTVAMSIFNGWTWIQMGLGDFILPSVLKGAFPALASLVVLIAWKADLGLSVSGASLAYLASVLTVTVVAGVRLMMKYGRPRFSASVLRSSLRYGTVYQGALLAQLVTYRADQWVLGVTRSSASLGMYSVAVSLSEIATYVSLAQGMIQFRSASRDEVMVSSHLIRRTVLGALIGIVFVAASVPLIPLVFGSEYQAAIVLTLLLLPGTIGLALFRVCGNDLAGRGRPGLVSVVAVVQAPMMVAAYIVLIPSLGTTAAAVITSVGYCAGGACIAALMLRVNRANPSDAKGADPAEAEAEQIEATVELGNS